MALITVQFVSHLIVLEIFGIVVAKTPLVNKRIIGMKNVSLQCPSMTAPITIEPTTLPSLPAMIVIQTAIARILVGKSSTVEALRTLIASLTIKSINKRYEDRIGSRMKIRRTAARPQEKKIVHKIISLLTRLISRLMLVVLVYPKMEKCVLISVDESAELKLLNAKNVD
jgi:hypothetical protein